MRLLLPALLVFLSACPDPSQTKQPGTGGEPGMAPPGAMPGGPGGPGMGGPPGGPAGAGGPGMAGLRPAAKFAVDAGAGVKISGKVSYDGAKTGTVRVDFLRTLSGSAFPELVHTVSLDKPGPFETEAPKDFGTVQVMAFIDSSEDGPTAGEPAGRYEPGLDIKAAAITGVDIVLSDRPELKDLAPPGPEKAGAVTGMPPAEGGIVPPPPEPPAEGGNPAGPADPAAAAAGAAAPAAAAPAGK